MHWLKQRLWYRCFPVNFSKLKNTFSYRTLPVTVSVIVRYVERKGFKFFLMVQMITIQYIVNTVSRNSVWYKSGDTQNCKKLTKHSYFLLANTLGEPFPRSQLEFFQLWNEGKFCKTISYILCLSEKCAFAMLKSFLLAENFTK